MLKAGRTQTLTVNRISDYGLYLIDDEQNEVLLPNRGVPQYRYWRHSIHALQEDGR